MKKRILCMLMAVVFAVCTLSITASAATKKLGTPSVVILTKTDTSIKLRWNAVKNAEKYQVYYSTSKNGTYKKYTTTSKLNVTVSKLKADTKYYFKVRATASSGGKTIKSSYSNVKNAATLTKEEAAKQTNKRRF